MASINNWLEIVAPLMASTSTGAFAGWLTNEPANAGSERALWWTPSRSSKRSRSRM